MGQHKQVETKPNSLIRKIEANSKYIELARRCLSRPRVRFDDMEGLTNVFDLYLKDCEELGFKPGKNLFCVSIGISKSVFEKWINGEEGEILQNFAELVDTILAGFVEQQMTSDTIKPMNAMYLLNNQYKGYRSVSEVVQIKKEEPKELTQEDIEQIRSKYINSNIELMDKSDKRIIEAEYVDVKKE